MREENTDSFLIFKLEILTVVLKMHQYKII